MSYEAVIVAHVVCYRRSAIQFDKIGSKYAEQIMTKDEKAQDEGASLQDTSLLEDLIKRSREGDIQAMEAIYERFNRPIFSLAYRYTYNSEAAEDLLQDIFIKVFTHFKELQTAETFIGWLYRIAINTCYSYLRSKKSQLHRTIPLDEVEGTIEGEINTSGDKIMKKSLEDAIQNLQGKLKTIFLLHDVQGFKHEEIARILGCSVGTSKSQLFKARKKIRKRLENKHTL